jgi:hypothetical protein
MKIGNDLNSTGPVRGTSRAKPTASLRNIRKTGYAAPMQARSASADISSPAQLLARAAGDLETERDVRNDVVDSARAQVRNWQGLSGKQLDELVDSLLSDLS